MDRHCGGCKRLRQRFRSSQRAAQSGRLARGHGFGRREDRDGFSDVEEDYGDRAAGVAIMPWRLEPTLRERGGNYVSAGLFKAFAIRDGRLVTGQQQYSGRKVAQTVIEMLGV